ncbi:MAG: uroporphyrinogen decarboxylase family protein [Planctomycetota bacterium]|jgi:uroporphyrinogen decarboxylase
MAEMTTHERVKRMYEHREADRVPVTDGPWGSTVERWRKEGLPEGTGYVEYFGLDTFASIGADNSPRYPVETVAEDEESITQTTKWGATVRNWKHRGGVPEFIDCRIKDRESWAEAKKRMTPDRDRIYWERLGVNYPKWRQQGAWISAGFWFGFDVTHARTVGTERLLTAMALDPEWAADMFNHWLDVDIALFEMVWDAGYTFDCVAWPDDMGYKHSQFFSLEMYRELLKPAHKRACDWAHARGCKVHLHSCGDIEPFVPDLIEIGIDMLNPLEVKAGMDPVKLKGEYGDRLAFHGGLNALLYETPGAMSDEMRRVIPVMKEGGGYIAGSDHSVPESVSLEEFREFVRLAKELGSYE